MNMNLTEVIFILDASGSMYSLTDETVGGFNSLIEKQKSGENNCNVTTVLFNDHTRKIHDCVNVKDVFPLTKEDYCTYGTTALLDAVGSTIDEVGIRLAATPEEERPCKVTVVITTDGYENASYKYTQEKIKQMIELQQNTYNWTFMFLGANIDAEQVGTSYGIKSGYSKTYTASTRGVDSVYTTVANSLDYINTKACSMSWTEEDDNSITSALNSIV